MNNIMNSLMHINGKYRIVLHEDKDIKKQYFKIQMKFICFWITIKTFFVSDYFYDFEFCFLETKELYYKIVDPYGEF